jgi:hypothetical protein
MSEFYAGCSFAEIVSSFVGDCSKQFQSFAGGGASPASNFVPDL